MPYYIRIDKSSGYAEYIDTKSGKLSRVIRVDDIETVPTYEMQCRNGKIQVSAMIPEASISYLKNRDIIRFLPNTEIVRGEICSRISEGENIGDLREVYLGHYPLPPEQVISMWARENKEFRENLQEARRLAARIKFDKALTLANEAAKDPKALKTIVDILKRHAEVDDPEVFQVKSREDDPQPPNIHISFNTGVPDPIDITPEIKQIERDRTQND